MSEESKFMVENCPLCDESPAFHPIIVYPNGERSPSIIKCRVCGISVASSESDAAAVEKWNTRPEEDRLRAERDAVNEKLNNERGEVTTLQMELGSMEVRVVYAEAELQQARSYVNALIDGLTADQFCGLVEARKVDGIRAWLEVGNPPHSDC